MTARLLAVAVALFAGFGAVGVVHRHHRTDARAERQRIIERLWNDLSPGAQANVVIATKRWWNDLTPTERAEIRRQPFYHASSNSGP